MTEEERYLFDLQGYMVIKDAIEPGALAEGGKAITLEFIPNPDRVTPPGAATFSMTMLGATPHGDTYTFPEYDGLFTRAGISKNELHALPSAMEQIIISHK